MILTHGMDTQVINVQGVPVTPVGADQAVERVHKVDVPVDCHVGNPLGTPQVPIVLVTKLGDYKVTGGRGAFAGVKSIGQIVVTKIFRSQGDTRGHVSLSRATVIVVTGSIDTGSIEGPTVDQKATHREISAREATTFLDLNKPLTNEVLTVIRNFLHDIVSFMYLLLEHVLPRGGQP